MNYKGAYFVCEILYRSDAAYDDSRIDDEVAYLPISASFASPKEAFHWKEKQNLRDDKYLVIQVLRNRQEKDKKERRKDEAHSQEVVLE